MLLPPPQRPSHQGAAPSSTFPATVAVWGPGAVSSLHAHHAIHLVFARTGTLQVAAAGAPARQAAAVYVPSDLPHSIDATGAEVIIVFVEPESERGAGLTRSLGRDLQTWEQDQFQALLQGLSRGRLAQPDIEAWLRALFERLGVEPRRPVLHPGVTKVLAHLRDGAMDTSHEALAQVAGLSPSRLSHAFKESVGLPLRTYLLWQRLLQAASALQGAPSLAAAAHATGFSDAAHMTRTFRRMFGATPSEMLDRSRNVQATEGDPTVD